MSDTTEANHASTRVKDLIEELRWRGLFYQCTDEEGLQAHLSDANNNPRRVYVGFDPTANSMTIGNLVPMMLLAHAKRAGHEPIALMGGGTGLIGDPSGKSAERTLNTEETVQGFVEAQRPIFDAVLGRVEVGPAYRVLNNAEWLTKISYIEALRDIGKFFSVNMMMQKESVKARLNSREQGISYTEFSYMILQAYDFAHLFETEGVTVQIGGSDQYGNIVAGTDLIRRRRAIEQDAPAETFGLTVPLVQKSDGGKFGKTESGAVWLTADRTSSYAYYQFWLNATDDDASSWIKVFTFLPQDEVEALLARHAENPGKRELQRTLAQQATAILHGEETMLAAERAGKALFSGEIAELDEHTLREVLADVPSSERDRADLVGGVDAVDALIQAGLASSKREAREFIGGGSVSVNGTKIAEGQQLTGDHLLHGSLMAIRRGKKKWHLIRWS